MEGQTTDLISAHEDEHNTACAKWCLTEFQSENIGFEHDRPVAFVTSQWSGRSKMYILYRVLVGVALLGWVSGDIIYETNEFYHGQAWRWLCFATNWSLALLAFTAVFQAVTSAVYEYKPYWIMDPIYIRAMPVVLKIQWILFNASSNSAFVVSTGYWAFLAFVSNARNFGGYVDNFGVKDSPTLLTSDMSRLKHTANSIYVIADVMIGATPIRVYHMFITVFLGSLYTVFNALYFINNGSLILKTGVAIGPRTYYFMNWSQPVEAICTCVLGVLMCVASQLILHGLYHLRLWIHRRLYPGAPGIDSELQNIVTSSASYNSLEESYGEKIYGDKRTQ